MNKKEVMQSVKVIVLGILFGVGISYVSATLPSNVDGPLNVGLSNQTKAGGLAVGITSWPTFTEQNGAIIPTTFNVSGTATANTLIASNITAGVIGFPSFAAHRSAPVPLCVNSGGNIVLCNNSGPTCGPAATSGNSSTMPTDTPPGNLCATGTLEPGGVTGTGPWNWGCTDGQGGNVSCSTGVVPVTTSFIFSLHSSLCTSSNQIPVWQLTPSATGGVGSNYTYTWSSVGSGTDNGSGGSINTAKTSWEGTSGLYNSTPLSGVNGDFMYPAVNGGNSAYLAIPVSSATNPSSRNVYVITVTATDTSSHSGTATHTFYGPINGATSGCGSAN